LSSEKRALRRLRAFRRAASAGRWAIAIVGLGCRPGGADSPAAFWELLRNGVDAISRVPAGRWDAQALYDPDPQTPQDGRAMGGHKRRSGV
jgi:acyl transferase domain-containing protein